jgi:cation diffusion facilitator family transporter
MGHGHTHHPGDLTQRAAFASVGVAIVLITIKALAWFSSGSVAMLSSLTDSGLDFFASLVTLFAVRYAQTPPDAEHRFGHGKAEAFAGLFQAGLVFFSAALVGREAVVRLLHPMPVQHEETAMMVMGVSLVFTIALVLYQGHVKHQTGSLAIAGDRMHYLTDIASNLVALGGIGMAMMFGWHQADAVAGLLVCVWLVGGAIAVLRDAADHLMDKGAGAEIEAGIKAALCDAPEVLDVHDMRSRAAGPFIHVQCHIMLEPAITLTEAHAIMVAAEKRVLALYPKVDLLMHPDPKGYAEPHGGSVFQEQTQ